LGGFYRHVETFHKTWLASKTETKRSVDLHHTL
jgi:hypothetical protein